MENAIGAILAPGNDHHEHDDSLTEASGEEEEADEENLASPPELISSDEEDEEDIFDGMVVTGVVVNLQAGGQGHLHLSPSRSLVNGALGQVVGIQVREEVQARGLSHQHLVPWRDHECTRECNAVRCAMNFTRRTNGAQSLESAPSRLIPRVFRCAHSSGGFHRGSLVYADNHRGNRHSLGSSNFAVRDARF